MNKFAQDVAADKNDNISRLLKHLQGPMCLHFPDKWHGVSR